MKKVLLTVLLCLPWGTAFGQGTSAAQNARRIISGTAIPNAPCRPGPPWTDFYIRTTTGVVYYCSAAPSTWTPIPVGSGDVSAGAVIADNAVVRGDGGAKGVQSSLVTISDAGLLTAPTLMAAGDISTSAGNVGGGSGNVIYLAGRWHLKGPSDGVLTLFNNGETDFARLQFGGTTSTFPALKRSTTGLIVRLADDSADAPFTASILTASTSSSLGVASAASVTAGVGSAASPSLRFSDDAATGFYKSTSTIVDLSIGGAQTIRFSANGLFFPAAAGNFVLSSGGALQWSSGTAGAAGADLSLSRAAAANLRHGATDAAAPVAQTISVQNVVAGTSNTAGANFTIAGSQGTGTGVGGSLIFQVAPAGSTGTAVNALADRLTLGPTNSKFNVAVNSYLIIAGPSNQTSYIQGDIGEFATVSGGKFSFASSATNVFGGIDTTISRNAAGVVQFGTTAANASGSTLAVNSTLTGLLTTTHIKGGGSTPAIANGAGAGTSPGTPTIAGTDSAGQITIITGTLPSVSAVAVTVTFASAYGTAPYVVIWPANANAATLGFLPFVGSTTTTFTVNTGTIALGGSSTYIYNYVVVQ